MINFKQRHKLVTGAALATAIIGLGIGQALLQRHAEAQDANDGASLLLDAAPLLAELSDAQTEALCRVFLGCPPLSGGPAVLSFPVLRVIDGRLKAHQQVKMMQTGAVYRVDGGRFLGVEA